MIVLRRTIEQSLSVALNGGQRRSQLVGYVSNKVPACFLHSLGLGQVTQNGNRASTWHGRRSHIKGAARKYGSSSGRCRRAAGNGSAHRPQKIGIAHGL